MIEEIHIRDLGVVADAVLPLASGFTALTGETGAGKTMLLTGLGLLCGGRADASRVRAGAARAEVEGRVVVAPSSRAALRVAEAGGVLDDGVLVLARTIAAEGRGRAYAGGRTVPAGVLADLADDLVAIHGQSDQQRLARPAVQRGVLDRFGGAALGAALAAYQDCYDEWRAAAQALAEVTGSARERAREADLLRLGLGEVEAVAPEPGEDRALAVEADRLRHAESLREAATVARSALTADAESGPDVDVLTLVSDARRALDQVRGYDAALGVLADRLAEVSAVAADLAAELSSYEAAVEADPLRLAAVEERRASLTSLTRKYGPDVDAVLRWAAESSGRLAELDGDDDRVQELTATVDRLRDRLGPLAADLHAARLRAGEQFGALVSAELAALAMPTARVRFAVVPRCPHDGPDAVPPPAAGDGSLGDGHDEPAGPAASQQIEVPLDGGVRWCLPARHGIDDVTLVMSAHRGAPELPVAQAASGGERSRIMLAVEVVLAGADPVPTFVFDEVDAGVGGRAAVEVGRRLARLAREAQVVVVTHLPQVAAFADHHLVVARRDDGGQTLADVAAVVGAEREREIARMLAGHDDSASALEHARELLAAGEVERGSDAETGAEADTEPGTEPGGGTGTGAGTEPGGRTGTGVPGTGVPVSRPRKAAATARAQRGRAR